MLLYSLCTYMTLPIPWTFSIFSHTRKVVLASYFTYEDAYRYATEICMFTDEQFDSGIVFIEPDIRG